MPLRSLSAACSWTIGMSPRRTGVWLIIASLIASDVAVESCVMRAKIAGSTVEYAGT